MIMSARSTSSGPISSRGRWRPGRRPREADLGHPLGEQQRRQRRRLGGLEDHRVAGRHGRDAVAERVRERVVPRPDDADQPDRAVADDELAAEHERVGGADLLVAEVVGRVLGPEAERVGRVGDLGEQRVLVGLAGLRDERLGDPLRVVDHPLLGAAAGSCRGRRSRAPPTRAARRGRARPSRAARRSWWRGRCRMSSPVAGFWTAISVRCSSAVAIRLPRRSRSSRPRAAGRGRRSAGPRARRRSPCRTSPRRTRCACRRATGRRRR